MKDIAARVGVSQVTVSHVLGGRGEELRISSVTAERIVTAARELGYRPSALARSFKTHRSMSIGLAVGDLLDPFWAGLAVGAQQEAEQHGYTIVVVNTLESEEKERLVVDMLRERRLDGVILSPGHAKSRDLAALKADGFPFVFVDRTIDGMNVPSVVGDNIGGAGLAVDYLVSRGHRKIAYLGGTLENSTFRDRWIGFRRALARHRLKPGPHAISPLDPDAAGEAVRRLFAGLPTATAVMTASMWLTVGVLRTVPDDVAVVGFDQFLLPDLMRRQITAVVQPVKELGHHAVRLLLETMANPALARQLVLPTRLVVRGSDST